MNTDPTITQGIAHFLDRVSEHLISKTPAQRRELLADLEAHIYEALASRAQDRQPNVDDLQAVLAEIDPPESYDQTKQTSPPSETTMAMVALSISLGTLVLAGLIGVLTAHFLKIWIPYFLFLGGQIAALVLGIIARTGPFGKAAIVTSCVLIVLSILYLS